MAPLRISLATGLSAVAMLALPMAAAADRAGSWEARADIVYQNSSDWDFDGGTTAEIDSDTSFLFGLSYHFSENLEFGGNLTFGQTDYDAESAELDRGRGARRSDLSAAPSKTLKAWMEGSGAQARGSRPREPCSAPSAVLRVLRVDLLVSCDQGVRVVDRFNYSDPLISCRTDRRTAP